MYSVKSYYNPGFILFLIEKTDFFCALEYVYTNLSQDDANFDLST